MVGVEFGSWAMVYAHDLWAALNEVAPFATLLTLGFAFFMAPRLVRWIRSTFGG